MKKIKLTTGITTRFSDNGGEIKVSTDSEKNFLPYIDTFSSFEILDKIKQSRIKYNN